ncbi:hypothetical protein DRN46_01170 [Thermococci archaeon]|nr:MAG: hypothetical protein DRN46_01170 [Thermococci archaeon]RLF96016.1 MAG: hypothetical protein DRN52_03140 [Thermococci archaeon]
MVVKPHSLEFRILKELSRDMPLTPDELSCRLKVKKEVVLGTLIKMKMRGLVKNNGDRYFLNYMRRLSYIGVNEKQKVPVKKEKVKKKDSDNNKGGDAEYI